MRFGAGLRVGVGLERWTRLGVRTGLRLRGRDLGLGAGLKVEMVLGGGGGNSWKWLRIEAVSRWKSLNYAPDEAAIHLGRVE